MDNSIIPIIKELERVYDALAKKFDLKHDRPVITIQTKGRLKQSLGWQMDSMWERGKKSFNEINICAEDLKLDPIETLIHEMAHHSNSCNKVEDCSNSGYHNKEFKLTAEKYGLNVNKSGRHGWAETSLSDGLKETLKTLNIDYKVFELYRKPRISIAAPTKMKKYRCDCTTIRCATELLAKCLKCSKEFQPQEE